MFEFFKRKKKVNIIANRVKVLNDKLWLIHTTGKESRLESKVRYFRSNSIGSSTEYRVMSIDTYFGERKIAINSNTLYYGGSDLIKVCDKVNEWSFNFDYLFCIELKHDNVVVKFLNGLEMTKEEIDLAILEFEKEVDRVYTEIIEGNKSYNDVVEYLVNGA